jgi:DNA polymerase beta
MIKNSKNKKIISEFLKLVDQISYDIDHSYDKNTSVTNSYRLRQIKNVIKIITDYDKQIKKGSDLANIKGVGKNSVKRIDEILKTGFLNEIKLNRKNKNILKHIENLEEVIGIGRKKAVELIKKHNIKSVSGLIKAHKDGKIELNDKILLGLKYYGKIKKHIPRKEVLSIDKYLYKMVFKLDKELFGIICGSYRRQQSYSNDIDLLIVHPNIKTLNQLKNKENLLIKLVKKLKQDKFILDDMTDKNYVNKYMGFCQYKNNPIRRIDIRYMPYKSYYAALLYFTGSRDFNKKMRMIAIELGYKLNEYGLYKIKNNKYHKVKVNSEKDIFTILNMEYVLPKNR